MAFLARHRLVHRTARWVLVSVALGALVGPVRADDVPTDSASVDQANQVRVEPADSPLAERIAEWAGQPRGDRPRDRRYWIRELPSRVQLALQSEGYYGVPVDVRDADAGVTIALGTGTEVRLNEVAVSVPGARSDAPTLLDWLDDNSPVLGARLQHATYESLRDGLLNRAISLGFLEAAYTRQQLSVSLGAASAAIELELALGPAYRIGTVTIDDSPIREDIVRNLAPFDEGGRYSADVLAEYARRLRDNRFFARARVLPEFDKVADGAVPLRVELEARKPNRVRLGAGYATDVGVRLRGGWDRYLIDDRGHSAALDLELSEPRRSANVEYRVPDSDRPATRAWLFSAGALRETVDGASATQQNARVARERRHSADLVDTRYLRYQRDRGLPGDSGVEFRALMAGYDVRFAHVLSWRDVPDIPLDGSVQLLAAHEDLGADFGFIRAYSRTAARFEMQPRHWLRGRLELGRLWQADVASMPTSLRFFAGGDGSIRGFGPRDASPQNAEGTATGGNRLLVASLEYEYRFRESWGAAVFADRGRAWVDSGEPVRTGAGLGVRWYSPVGPVMFDVARPVTAGDGDWRIHLTIGL